MGWLNDVAAVAWRIGRRRRRGELRNANELVDGLTIEDLLARLQLGGVQSKAGVSVTVDRATRVSAVYASCRAIQDPIAASPLLLYRRTGDEDEVTDRADPLFRLLRDRPNEWQTAFEFRELMQRDLLLRGNAYALIVRGRRGQVSELLRLHPDAVEPKQDQATLAVVYEYRRPDGAVVVLQRREVFHLRGLGDDGLKGASPIGWFRETIGDAIATQEHGSRFWSNGAKPLGLLVQEAGTTLSDKARKDLRDDFQSMYAGGEKAYQTAVLPAGIKYESVEINHEDAQFLDTRKLQRSEIAAMFRVPPHKIGDLERATFSNIEHQAIEFVTDTITPWAVRWEQAIHRDLLDSDPDRFVRFNLGHLLRGDFKSRQEGLQIQRRNGVISANEWRRSEEMNGRTDAGGDQYIVESNMALNDGSNPAASRQASTPPADPAPRAADPLAEIRAGIEEVLRG